MATGSTRSASAAPEQPPEQTAADAFALAAAAAFAGAVLLAVAAMFQAFAASALVTARQLAAILRAGLAPAFGEARGYGRTLMQYASSRVGAALATSDPLIKRITSGIDAELAAILTATQALADALPEHPSTADLDAVSAAARSAMTAAERAARDVATRAEALAVATAAPAGALLIWHAVGPNPCPACLALDGRPAPSLPPLHPNCQCTVTPE